MQDFKNLRVWRHAHALSLNVDKTAREIRNAEAFFSHTAQVQSVRKMLCKLLEKLRASIKEAQMKKKPRAGSR